MQGRQDDGCVCPRAIVHPILLLSRLLRRSMREVKCFALPQLHHHRLIMPLKYAYYIVGMLPIETEIIAQWTTVYY